VPQTLPLAHRRILITRAKEGGSEDLAGLLRSAGATVISVPTIEIVPPDSYTPLDQALLRLDRFEWVVFTSARAVEVFAARRNPTISPKRIAVIGPATGRAVEKAGLEVALMPPQYIAESLAQTLEPHVAGAPVLLIRAAEGRDVLPEVLRQAGAELTIVEAYRNQPPKDSIFVMRQLFASPDTRPELITFTSGSTARNLTEMLRAAAVVLPQGTVLASIGPITSQAMRDAGLIPTIVAAEATLASLTEAICDYFGRIEGSKS